MVFYVRSSVDFHELGNLTRCAAILSTKLLDLFDSHFGKRFFGVPVQNLSRLARFTKGSSWVLCWLCWNRYSRRCHSTKKGTLVFFSMGLSAHIRQTPKRGWLVSPKRQDGKTLFLKKILRPEGYVHRSNSLDPISQPAAQLVVILPYIFALGVLWVLILFLAEPMSFQKMGWKKKKLKSTFLCQNLDGSTHSYWKARTYVPNWWNMDWPWVQHDQHVEPTKPMTYHDISRYGHPTAGRPITGQELRIASGSPGRSIATLCGWDKCQHRVNTTLSSVSPRTSQNSMAKCQMIRSEHPFCSGDVRKFLFQSMSMAKRSPQRPKGPKHLLITMAETPPKTQRKKKNAPLIWVNWINPPSWTCVTQNLSWTSWRSWTV